ncbi:probable LRR receptor-like serine/threonine-protein kinase At4g29180 [Neltuma alba]|uniref:probable LRR receptor-like serine/threonine-protein kinase At4g29180 n=1 Tax=Neltuma alba TaxID=207710 RepID=UPI0010A3DCEC|nr:probable LRR receptor-like serine/threonine-protein kinase At4g29180 [Prosopis alba]
MDPRLVGKFSAASAWKFLEIALSCIPQVAIQRPDIGHVVADLKECLALEMSLQNAESKSGTSGSPLITTYFPLESNSGPCARFHRSGSVNKKSDVYSFGIILLELMTGQRPITETSDGARHISDWVNPKLETGDIQAIVDPRLEGKFSRASAWKFLEIAMSCITPAAVQRPDISSVVFDLKQCVAMEASPETSYSLSGSYSPPSAR